jgi:beta-lactam-binding protein with PASTA domain
MGIIQFIKSKSFLKQLVLAGVGIILFVFVIMQWLYIRTHHNQKIEVPNLASMELEDAQHVLDEIDLKLVVIDSASFNPNYPRKSVIEQDPEAGDFVKENRKIYLTLNPSGYKDVEIPDMYGKTRRQVTSQLLSIGFRVHPEPIYVRDLALDVVRGLQFGKKEIKPGDKIPKNSLITLKLGDGEGRTRYKRVD